MITSLISVGVGLVLGLSLGFKAGRGYERLRPGRRAAGTTKRKRSR